MREKKVVFGLIEGRQEIKEVREYIFPSTFFVEDGSMFDFKRSAEQVHNVLKDVVNPGDRVDVYVTGPTPALTAVISYASATHLKLVLWHYNRESDCYVPQDIHTDADFDLLREGGYYA